MITIGIVLYNEEKHMPLLLSNLQVLTPFFPKISVIVVDNGSTDGTRKVVKSLKTQFPITLIERSENNLGCARQDVVNAAQTDWVGFIDGDCGVNEEWARGVLECIPTVPLSVAAFGGPWLPAGQWADHYRALFRTPMGNFSLPQLSMVGEAREVPHIPTANVIYRKSDVLRAGGFLSQFAYVGEDLDLSSRIRQQGQKLWMFAGLPIYHYLPCSYQQWSKKIFSYGRGRVQVAAKNSKIFEYVLILPMLFIVLSILALVLGQWMLMLGYLMIVGVGSLFLAKGALLRLWIIVIITHYSYALGMAYEWWVQGRTLFAKQKPAVRKTETVPVVGKIANFAAGVREKT